MGGGESPAASTEMTGRQQQATRTAILIERLGKVAGGTGNLPVPAGSQPAAAFRRQVAAENRLTARSTRFSSALSLLRLSTARRRTCGPTFAAPGHSARKLLQARVVAPEAAQIGRASWR